MFRKFWQRRRNSAGRGLLAGFLICIALSTHASGKPPVLIGLDGEFGLENSTSAQAIELGLRAAITEINAAGGVLNGRPLALVLRDHRSMPARGIRNIEEFARMPGLVAVFGGRFSPVVIEELPLLRQSHLPFMAVWSSADMIVDNGMQPNYVFRLSLYDAIAMPKMLKTADERGFGKIGLLLTNTSWGRSNLAAAEKYVSAAKRPVIVRTAWYNWKDESLVDEYHKLLQAGAQAIVLVANDDEGAILVREVAQLPAEQRIPILSHWGVTGGKFFEQAGAALQQVDFSVIQTFSFFTAEKQPLARFMKTAKEIAGIKTIEEIESPVGVAHAYDLMHILARAINIAGTDDRSAVRDAMEKVRDYHGLVRYYRQPFTPARHEALGPDQLLMAVYRSDGVLVPAR
jgi:branched-chain amino acid transport system substrate-binding protein